MNKTFQFLKSTVPPIFILTLGYTTAKCERNEKYRGKREKWKETPFPSVPFLRFIVFYFWTFLVIPLNADIS